MDNENIASYNPMREWPEAISGAYDVFNLLRKLYCCFGGPRAGPAWWGGSVSSHSYSCLREDGQQTEPPCEGSFLNIVSSDVPGADEHPFHSQIIA